MKEVTGRIRKFFRGTALYEPVRFAYFSVFPRGRSAYIERRDARALKQIFERLITPTSNCVDIGAHEGMVLEPMMKRATEGKHFAFEPLARQARGLRERFPGVTVYEMAVGDKSGEAVFNRVVDHEGYSGLRERNYPVEKPRIERVKVKVRKLDDVLDAKVRVDVMKVDVEGGELPVFKGGIETLKRWHPVIIFEHGGDASSFYGVKSEEVYDFLTEQLGMGVWGLATWVRGDPPMTRKQFVRVQGQHRVWNFIAMKA